MAEQFAKENNLFSFECSAKTGEGIEKIFNKIVTELSNKTKD
jgi:hypothetical protein